MKKISYILIILLFAFPAWASQTISFSDSDINVHGRYITDEVGTNLTWHGSWMKFKVTGTTSVSVLVQSNTATGSIGAIIGYIDGGTTQYSDHVTVPVTNTEETLTLFTSISTAEHTIMLQYYDLYTHSTVLTSEYIKIKGIIIDDGATLTPWVQSGTYDTLWLGDSWSGAASHSTPRYIDSTKYDIYGVAFSGFTASLMNTYYPYKADGVAHTDPSFQLCVIQLGINDARQSVTTANFKTQMQSLITTVKAEHQDIIIFLIRMPYVEASGYDYGQYGTVLSELASTNGRTYYIDTESIWGDLVWQEDNTHITAASMNTTWAPYIQTQISAVMDVYPSLISQGTLTGTLTGGKIY